MNESSHASPKPSQPHDDAPQGASSDSSVWLRLLVLLNIAVLTAVIIFLVRGNLWSDDDATAKAAAVEQWKATAEALEERGLDAQAADAWQQYLDAIGPQPIRAEVLGHIGWLRLRAEQYGAAAGAFVEADLAAGDNKELKEKVGDGLLQAYRAMGRFGAIGREMSRQAEGGSSKSSSPAVAQIGDETITEADLNRMVEHRVDQMLASQDALGDSNRRQTFLRQVSEPAVRAQLLRDLVQTELFVRRARELQLDKQLDFLLDREQTLDSMLFRRLLQHELQLSPPTADQLKAYYEAHKADFRQPDSMNVVIINTPDEKKAAEMLEKIHSADEFRKLAEDPGDGANGFAQTLFRGQPSPLLGDVDSLFKLEEGQWTKEPIVRQGQQFLILVVKKEPAKTIPLEAIRENLRNLVARQQQQKAVDKLFAELADRYQVKLFLTPPPKLDGVSSQSDQMLGETGPADIQPAVPAKPSGATTEKPDAIAPPEGKMNQPVPPPTPSDTPGIPKKPERK